LNRCHAQLEVAGENEKQCAKAAEQECRTVACIRVGAPAIAFAGMEWTEHRAAVDARARILALTHRAFTQSKTAGQKRRLKVWSGL
jgi:hypothetical protein